MKTRARIGLMSVFLLSFFLAFSVPAAAQTTYIVDQGGGGDFTAIQDCIDAAVDGDTCQVNSGTYVEHINFSGKNLTLVSTSGPEVTIIDGDLSGIVVVFESGETLDAVIDGFTIQNGGEYMSSGGGISCQASSPTITNCVITSNYGFGGGGIFCNTSSATISNCMISGNFADTGGGGGIYIDGGSPTITNSTISDNYAPLSGGGIVCKNGSSLTITNSTISGNVADDYFLLHYAAGGGIACLNGSILTTTNCMIIGNDAFFEGGGIYSDNASGTITNCTISGNTVGEYGGGVYCTGSSFVFSNSILWADTSGYFLGRELGIVGGSTVTMSHSDVQGGEGASYVEPDSTLDWGAGNISLNPLFAGAGDYHLTAFSPCIDTGDNSAPGLPPTDLDGNPRVVDGDNDSVAVVDMGAYEFQPAPAWAAASSIPTDAHSVQATKKSLKISFPLFVGLPLVALLLYISRLSRMTGKSDQ